MSDDAAQSDDDAPAKKRRPPIAVLAAVGAFILGIAGGFVFAPLAFGPKSASAGEQAPNSEGDEEHKNEKAAHEKSSDAHAKNETHSQKKTAPKLGKSHESDVGHECAGKCDESFTVAGDTGYYTPDPLIVSIRPGVRLRQLKVAIVIETEPEAGARFGENSMRIRDALITYLRAVDPATLEDPNAFADIRTAIARRVSAVVAPASVRAVLITDFILT